VDFPALADSAAAAHSRLLLDAVGHAALGVAPPLTPPTGITGCPATWRATIDGRRVDGVGWSVRPDSSAVLYAATSRDSGTIWDAPIIVDSVDRARTGCDRPAPAIASRSGNVYVAYAMRAPEGTGVFFSHAMDVPGMRGIFHAPSAVIYGDRLVRVAVAADSDRLAIAYEDPSGDVRRVGLALSRSQGHPFEWHLVASPSSARAIQPEVALRDSLVAVIWRLVDGGAQLRLGHVSWTARSEALR
jgi:hypothetical protein